MKRDDWHYPANFLDNAYTNYRNHIKSLPFGETLFCDPALFQKQAFNYFRMMNDRAFQGVTKVCRDSVRRGVSFSYDDVFQFWTNLEWSYAKDQNLEYLGIEDDRTINWYVTSAYNYWSKQMESAG